MAFKDIDIALLVGATPRGPGMERTRPAQKNADVFKAQGRALNEVAKQDCKVLVVGNPANTNAYIAMKSAPNLQAPRTSPPCCASTTTARCRSSPKKTGKPVEQLREADRVGQPLAHHVPRLPLRDRGRQGGAKLVNDDTWIKETFMPTVGKRGAAIIEARGLVVGGLGGQRGHRSHARLVAGRRQQAGSPWACPPTASTTSPRT